MRFWKLRQSEYEAYTLLCAPAVIRQVRQVACPAATSGIPAHASTRVAVGKHCQLGRGQGLQRQLVQCVSRFV